MVPFTDRDPPSGWTARLVVLAVLWGAFAAVALGWLVGLAVGAPGGVGASLLMLCLALLLVIRAVAVRRPPPPVPPPRVSGRVRWFVYTVAPVDLVLAGYGRWTDNWTLIQAAIAPTFVLLGAGGVLGVRRIARLWPALSGVLAGEDDLPEDEL